MKRRVNGTVNAITAKDVMKTTNTTGRNGRRKSNALTALKKKRKKPALTPREIKRLEHIRVQRNWFTHQGIDTRKWETTFFLDLVDKLRKR